MKIDLKKLAPYIIAVIAFCIITVVYFSPVFKGKVIKSHDIMQHKGASKEIVDYRKETGEEALWTNAMFGGMPAYQISTLYPNNFLKHIDSALKLYMPHPAGIVFMYFFGFFILLLCLKVDPRVAIIGAIGYGLSSYFFIIFAAGHNTKASAIAYMAPLLGGVFLILREKKFLGLVVTSLFGGLELYSNHVQVTYYLILLVTIILLFELYYSLKEKRIKKYFISILFIGLAGMIGFLPNITNILTTMEYGKYSNRGKTELTIMSGGVTNKAIVTEGVDKEYATNYSYGIGETFTFMVPNFKGGASEPISKNNKSVLKEFTGQDQEIVGSFSAYFGQQPQTSGPVYIGIIFCALAFLGMFIIKNPIKWPLFVGTIITVMLGWGKNLMWFSDIFFDYFPMYNKFRAVTIILVIAELTIPLLAILTIDELIKKPDLLQSKINIFKKEIEFKKILFGTYGFLAVMLILFYLMPAMFNEFSSQTEIDEVVSIEQSRNASVSAQQIKDYVLPVFEKIESARISIFKKDVGIRLVFLLLSFAGIFMLLRKKISITIFSVIFSIIILLDMWPVVARYINKDSFEPKSANETNILPSKADEFILADKSLDFRVFQFGNPFNDASTSYFHKSIGGYHGAKLKRYQELIEFRIMPEYKNINGALSNQQLTDSLLQSVLAKQHALNMLNTKYIIYNPEAAPIENRHRMGNAWFVTKIKYVPTADAEITSLDEVNPRWYAVINEKYKQNLNGFDPSFDSTATIKLTSYAPNKLVYESNAKKDQLAIFSEIYYPKGWNAYVDGLLTEHINADYVLRAMKVPAGKHNIEFKFEPSTYYTGEKIALVGSVLLLLTIFGGIYLHYKKETSI